MNQRLHRKHVRFCSREPDELKITNIPKRSKRKQALCAITNVPNKRRADYKLGVKKSQINNKTVIGKYFLSEINPTNCLCEALHSVNNREYACRVVQANKYKQLVYPYYHMGKHDHINEIMDIHLKDEHAYIIFERSFGDLHSYIRLKKKLDEEETSRLFKQIVEVVEHCHSSGVVLRDLKLRKFVFKDKERTKLKLESLDDAYIITNNSDLLHDKHGCPAYVSPEILESTDGYSSKGADIWSLGVMFYTMLCGRYPFHDPDPIALFNKIKNGSFSLVEPISCKGKCLMYTMLRKDPKERLSADELLEHPWFQASFDSIHHSRLELRKSDQLVPELFEIKSC